MGYEDLTPTNDDLAAEILSMLGDMQPPSYEEGWRTVADLMPQSHGLSIDQLRNRANAMVKAGKMEQVRWNKVIYYRIKR